MIEATDSSSTSEVWKLGRDVGMYELTTSTLSNCGYIFAFGGKRWKSNEHPNLTLAQAGRAWTDDPCHVEPRHLQTVCS